MTMDIFHTVKTISSGVTGICSIMGLIVIWVTIKHYFDERQIPDTERKKFYWDFFIPQYLDGYFVFYDKEDKKEKIDFKQARIEIEESYMVNQEWEEEKHKKFIELSKQYGTKENAFSHTLSTVLNRVGLAVFTGVIPIEHVMVISADTILKDWDKSKVLIEDKINHDGLNYEEKSLRAKIKYSRRFFQWIAIICAMYLICDFLESKNKKDIINTFRCLLPKNKIIDSNLLKAESKSLVKMLNVFQSVDKTILAPATKKYVKRLKRLFKKRITKVVAWDQY